MVIEWLRRIANDDWRGAKRVFAWSFYSQGTGEHRASAETFIDVAMAFFEVSVKPALTPWDKGVQLAEAVRAQRALLILDGVEPLQFPENHSVKPGRLKDPSLVALVKELAGYNPGLCLITTRAPITGSDRVSIPSF